MKRRQNSITLLLMILLIGSWPGVSVGAQVPSGKIALENGNGLTQGLEAVGCSQDWLCATAKMNSLEVGSFRKLPPGLYNAPKNCGTQQPPVDQQACSHEMMAEDMRLHSEQGFTGGASVPSSKNVSELEKRKGALEEQNRLLGEENSALIKERDAAKATLAEEVAKAKSAAEKYKEDMANLYAKSAKEREQSKNASSTVGLWTIIALFGIAAGLGALSWKQRRQIESLHLTLTQKDALLAEAENGNNENAQKAAKFDVVMDQWVAFPKEIALSPRKDESALFVLTGIDTDSADELVGLYGCPTCPEKMLHVKMDEVKHHTSSIAECPRNLVAHYMKHQAPTAMGPVGVSA